VCFVDVGGHIGLVSFDIAARRPDVKIHAIEPNELNAAAWRQNQQLNAAMSARLTQAGLSDHEGEARFALPSDSSSGMVHETGTVTVPLMTLDNLCAANGVDHIDVLKIDVQGHEVAVLQGAKQLLDCGAVGTIICEMCEPLLSMAGARSEDIMTQLKERGYRAVPVPEIGVRGMLPKSRWRTDDVAFER
jgi:FkbM family methyltransferase